MIEKNVLLLAHIVILYYYDVLFTLLFHQISSSLVWPLAAAGALLIAGSQMFYTMLYLDCEDAMAATSTCSLRDAHRMVFAILRGDSMVDVNSSKEMSTEAIIIMTMFLLFFAIFAVALFVHILLAAAALDVEQVALDCFWEPKLALLMLTANEEEESVNKLSSVGPKIQRFGTRDIDWDKLMSRMWDALTLPWSHMGTKEEKWYSRSVRSTAVAWMLGAMAIVLVPVWIVVGVLSLGILWPPQLRTWLFRPLSVFQTHKKKVQQSFDLSQAQLVDIRREMIQCKLMSYEKSLDVEAELRQLKELIQCAMDEE